MMKKAISSCLIALLAAGPLPATAGGTAGANPFAFLSLDANARPAALGGAYTAQATDANALFYNPAGLAAREDYEATFMHNQYLLDIKQEYAAFASPWGLGANLNYLNFGQTQQVTYSNPNGNGLPTTSANDLAFGIGYGRALGAGFSAGAGLKYLQEDVDTARLHGTALDLGGLYVPPGFSRLKIGAAFQNLGPSAQGAQLPLKFRLGGAYDLKVAGTSNLLSMDFMKEANQGLVVAMGVESRAAEFLALRLGFNSGSTAGPGVTAGVGFLFSAGSIDYAFTPMGTALGNVNRLSATVRWGGPEKAPAPAAAPERVQAPAPKTATVSEAPAAPEPSSGERADANYAKAMAALEALKSSISTSTGTANVPVPEPAPKP